MQPEYRALSVARAADQVSYRAVPLCGLRLCPMSTPPAIPGIPFRPLHRGHLRHGRGRAPRLPLRPPRLVQPGPGPARDRAASGRAAASAPGSRSAWTTRTTRRCPASGSCAARSRSCTTRSTASDKQSRYTERNVCICGGGRASLTRAVAALGQMNLGHFLPDYTAYEELLDIFKLFTSIPILLEGERGYHFSVDDLRREITGRGLSALLLSNPCNPTGRVIQGEELRSWVDVARELGCSLLIDEFYSHYVWRETDDGSRSRLRRALRGGRRRRPGGAVRRPHQELALSRLALHLDRGPAGGDRGGIEQRLVPRRRRQQAAPALGRAAARPGGTSRRRRGRSARRSSGSGRS